MSFLILDDDKYARIKEIKELAKLNQLSWEEMNELSKVEVPGGLNSEFTMVILPWYGVTYTEEWQCTGKILMRHISVSKAFKPGELPSVAVVAQIMKLFGFTNNLDDCIVHMEEFDKDRKAINIMEAIDISMAKAHKIATEESQKNCI